MLVDIFTKGKIPSIGDKIKEDTHVSNFDKTPSKILSLDVIRAQNESKVP